MTVALGLVPHTGWTWLVRVARPDGAAPRVEERGRAVALPVESGQLYHLAHDHTGDRETFFAKRRAEALAHARKAVAPFAPGAAHAVVVGKIQRLPGFEAILASHPMIHTAEGELWRALFAEACAALGLETTRAASSTPRPRDAAWLAAQGRELGSPWSKEVQTAALAALAR